MTSQVVITVFLKEILEPLGCIPRKGKNIRKPDILFPAHVICKDHYNVSCGTGYSAARVANFDS
jgi:hypothetical protein